MNHAAQPWVRKEVIGNATLYLGDCLEVLRGLGDGCQNPDVSVEQGRGAGNDLKTRTFLADAVIADPQYGVELEYGGSSDSLNDALRLAIGMIDACDGKCRVLLTTVGRYAMELELYKQRPPVWRLCWRKGVTSRPCAVGFTDWEPVFVYGEDVHRHSHDLFTAQPEIMGKWGHPCPKSVAWAKWLVGHFTASGETVLDPFMGSGTTGVAAHEAGREFIGIEIHEPYFDIACERIENAQRQQRMFA